MTLFKAKGKQLDISSQDKWSKPNSRRFESSDIIGDIVMMRNDKHFIIKVSNAREIKRDSTQVALNQANDYNNNLRNTIIMSIKQGMKLLIDNENNYLKVCDRLYYKFGRLMLS